VSESDLCAEPDALVLPLLLQRRQPLIRPLQLPTMPVLQLLPLPLLTLHTGQDVSMLCQPATIALSRVTFRR
jgi:hypothetical protein